MSARGAKPIPLGHVVESRLEAVGVNAAVAIVAEQHVGLVVAEAAVLALGVGPTHSTI